VTPRPWVRFSPDSGSNRCILVRRRRSRIDGRKLPPQLGDLQLDIAGLGRQQRITGAVAPIRPSIGTFVALGADHLGRLGVDQRLQHEFDTVRMTSISPPARIASSRSVTSDFVRATGRLPSASTWRFSRRSPGDQPQWWTSASTPLEGT
jgi:hypothetical protein